MKYGKYIVSLCDSMYDTCIEVVSFDTPEAIADYIARKCKPGITIAVRLNDETVDE